jgi:hypothetical protein
VYLAIFANGDTSYAPELRRADELLAERDFVGMRGLELGQNRVLVDQRIYSSSLCTFVRSAALRASTISASAAL